MNQDPTLFLFPESPRELLIRYLKQQVALSTTRRNGLLPRTSGAFIIQGDWRLTDGVQEA